MAATTWSRRVHAVYVNQSRKTPPFPNGATPALFAWAKLGFRARRSFEAFCLARPGQTGYAGCAFITKSLAFVVFIIASGMADGFTQLLV